MSNFAISLNVGFSPVGAFLLLCVEDERNVQPRDKTAKEVSFGFLLYF